MKVKKIECEQFAGIKDKSIEFSDKINVICGKNESGKSTMLELLHSLLFQKVALNKTTDKEFMNKNFPHIANGKDLDVIDGSIVFENDGEQYTLTKEWQLKTGSEKLKDSNGNITKNSEDIKELMKKILMFEQGVYDEIIFSSQKIPQHTLESIFNECGKGYNVKNELHSILMKSVKEIGGADIDTLENKINEKISELGSHFDVNARIPEGGANKEWKTKIGKILDTYYDLKKNESENCEVVTAERNIERISNEKEELKKEKETLRLELSNIGKYENIKIQKDSICCQIKHQKEIIDGGNNILPKWDSFKNRKNENDLESKKVIEVSKDDVNAVREKLNECRNIEGTFRGLNLEAKIENKSGKELLVTNAETGKLVDGSDGRYEINGCTSIELPGIINIKLTPKGVDFDELKSRYKNLQDSINEVFVKYNVKNLNELVNCKEKYDDYQKEKDTIKEIYENSIKEYEEKYKTIEGLKNSIEDAKSSIDKLKEDLSKLGDIPKEYERIDDFEKYRKEKDNRLKENDDRFDDLTIKLQNENAKIAGKDSESLSEKIEKCKKEFDDYIEEYKHYENILNEFSKLKKEIKDDPMGEIEDSFNKYLQQISNNDIKFSEGANLDKVSIESKNNMLTFNTLSEGTKATIGIAFKLSVLEHLFPEGQAVAIFDDPFTDMDEDRVKESCELIKKFSEKNQVIFVTCDEKYNKIFDTANLIKM